MSGLPTPLLLLLQSVVHELVNPNSLFCITFGMSVDNCIRGMDHRIHKAHVQPSVTADFVKDHKWVTHMVLQSFPGYLSRVAQGLSLTTALAINNFKFAKLETACPLCQMLVPWLICQAVAQLVSKQCSQNVSGCLKSQRACGSYASAPEISKICALLLHRLWGQEHFASQTTLFTDIL